MCKIYPFMREQGLQKEFFTVIIQNLLLMIAAGAAALLLFHCSVIPAITFFIFSVHHEFYTHKANYELKAKYKRSGLTAEEALDAYITDMCLIHTETAIYSKVWAAALAALALSVVVNQIAFSLFVSAAHLVLIAWEYRTSEFFKGSI